MTRAIYNLIVAATPVIAGLAFIVARSLMIAMIVAPLLVIAALVWWLV